MPTSRDTPPIIVIAGPTASGKSKLALEIGAALGGRVANADSIQVYRELRVLTARPGPEDEARAPHRLYGILPARERCSAARWREMAMEVVSETGAGPAVFCGGTGFYIEALLRGLSDMPETAPEIEAAGRAYHDHRAVLMVGNNEGLTKTYNRFHDPDERDPGIIELRSLLRSAGHPTAVRAGGTS